MNTRRSNKTQFIITVLASPMFYRVVVGFFVLQALWLALSSVYPMAFDEDFHFGIIKIYSHHWLPFLSQQPAGANMYGDVLHDPSYLYQYLMSFPYRVIEVFTKDQTTQVICLRLINIALFTYALVLSRRLLLRARVSPAVANVTILLFVLIPIVPLLAATINYDNLTMVFVAWICLVMADIIQDIQDKRIPIHRLGVLAILCLLGSIVKYPFIPIAAACVITTVVLWWHTFHGSGQGSTRRAIKASYTKLSITTKLALPILVLVSFGLFSQRYLFNLAAYRAPIPRCDKVLSVDDCMSYGPWARNYTDIQYKSTAFHAHITTFIPEWFYGIWYRLFFAINGNVGTPDWARYETIPPLPYPSITAIVITVATIILIVRWGRLIFRNDWLMSLFLFMTILYVGALFATDYTGYAHTGQPVAINGRYLLPLLLPIAAISARAWQATLSHLPSVKVALVFVVLLLSLQGGGVLTFMIDSNYTWYWPNPTVQSVNRTAQNVTRKIVLSHQPLHLRYP